MIGDGWRARRRVVRLLLLRPFSPELISVVFVELNVVGMVEGFNVEGGGAEAWVTVACPLSLTV